MKDVFIIGELEDKIIYLLSRELNNHGFEAHLNKADDVSGGLIISVTRESSLLLETRKIKFFNWDILFSVLGFNDSENDLLAKIIERVRILKAITDVSRPVSELEFHGSIRVHDLARSAKFYTWLFGVAPKEWTHRYVTFQRLDTKFNFVLLVSDGKELHHDTLYHLGIGVESKDKVISLFESAQEHGFHIEKAPRTTWRGTPLHELWLKDPDGILIEIYARLTEVEFQEMPQDKEPIFLT
jgi:catechol 2,3-dioxygenase-like lactoylglutathione lyase family enzyme